jgi:hypothetical protein
MQQKNTIIDILTMEKGSFPWWPSWVFFVELSPFIYIYIYFFFRDFGQTQSTTEETIDIIMLIPSNNNMITILAIKIQKTIKLLKYLQKRDIL